MMKMNNLFGVQSSTTMQTALSAKLRRSSFLSGSLVSLFLLGQIAPVAAAIENTATVTGTGPSGTVTDDSLLVSVPVVAKDAQYTAAKSVVSTGTQAGEDIVYRVTIVNTGNVTMDNIAVSDPGPTFGGNAATGTPVTITNADIISESDTIDTILQVGETIVYEFEYTMTQADVDNAAGILAASADAVLNTVAVTADDPDNVSTPPEAVGSTLTAETEIPDNTALTLDKVAYDAVYPAITTIGATPQAAGDVVYYRFTVTNTGNTTITGATITDGTPAFTGSDPLGTIALVGGTTGTAPGAAVTSADVAPGETAIFEVAYTVTQTDVDNQ